MRLWNVVINCTTLLSTTLRNWPRIYSRSSSSTLVCWIRGWRQFLRQSGEDSVAGSVKPSATAMIQTKPRHSLNDSFRDSHTTRPITMTLQIKLFNKALPVPVGKLAKANPGLCAMLLYDYYRPNRDEKTQSSLFCCLYNG